MEIRVTTDMTARLRQYGADICFGLGARLASEFIALGAREGATTVHYAFRNTAEMKIPDLVVPKAQLIFRFRIEPPPSAQETELIAKAVDRTLNFEIVWPEQNPPDQWGFNHQPFDFMMIWDHAVKTTILQSVARQVERVCVSDFGEWRLSFAD
jgi:hypothetical protein